MACDPNFYPYGRCIVSTDPPGTDLNRNFPCSWGEGVGTGTWLQGSSLPFWETYIGEDHFLLKSLIFLFYLRGCTSVRTGDQGNDGLSPPASEWYRGENILTARAFVSLFFFTFCELLVAINFSSGLPCDPQFWQPCDSPKPLFSKSRLSHYLSLQL